MVFFPFSAFGYIKCLNIQQAPSKANQIRLMISATSFQKTVGCLQMPVVCIQHSFFLCFSPGSWECILPLVNAAIWLVKAGHLTGNIISVTIAAHYLSVALIILFQYFVVGNITCQPSLPQSRAPQLLPCLGYKQDKNQPLPKVGSRGPCKVGKRGFSPCKWDVAGLQLQAIQPCDYMLPFRLSGLSSAPRPRVIRGGHVTSGKNLVVCVFFNKNHIKTRIAVGQISLEAVLAINVILGLCCL